MSLAVAPPGSPLWKNGIFDSAETKIRSQSLQPAGIMMHQQPTAQPATAATLEGGLIWRDSSRQMTADNLIFAGQQQHQSGMSPYAAATGSTLTAAAAGAARAGCCLDAQTTPEELGSDEADFDMHGLPAAAATAAAGGVAHGMIAGAEQQQGAAAESEPIATKQFTASSKKQLTSKFRGVCWNKKNKRWQAAINSGGKYIYLGSFTSEGDAARQFDRAAIKIRGKKAKLNFPARDYVDEHGNLLEDFELPAPASSSKQIDAGGSSRPAQPKLPRISTPSHHQQQQQQQQLEIEPLSVNAGMMQQQCSFGSQQAAAADAGWQPHMLMMQPQQQRHHGGQQVWLQQQQQPGQQQQLWHEQQQQQQLQHGQLPKAHTWQEHLLAQQSQHLQAEQQAGSNSSHLAKSKSLPPNAAVHAGVVGTAESPSSDIAGHAALILAQRRSGQEMTVDGRSAGEMHNSAAAAAAAGQAGSSGLQDRQACQPGSMFANCLTAGSSSTAAAAGSLRQTGVTVTTSVGCAGCSSGAGGFAGMVQDMQQQHELTVAELDLPPLVPLMPCSSMGDGKAMHMQPQGQQPQQLLSMPSYGMQPHQQQQQQGATWQQQQQQQGAAWQQQPQQQQQQQQHEQGAAWQQPQQLQVALSNGCPSALNTSSSTASAAQQYAQQGSVPQLQPALHANASAAAGVGSNTAFNNSSFLHICSAGSAHAASMSAPMQAAPMHHAMQQTSRFSSIPGPQIASQSSGMGHAPAVTHALSARMASCELGEAFQLARQAAAAQGVTDLTGALRQMSSAQLPVVTTYSGCSFQPSQQQGVALGAMSSSGLLQHQGSAPSVGVSILGGGTSGSGAAPLAMQLSVQQTTNLAVTQQSPAAAAAAAGSAGSPTKLSLTHGCRVEEAAAGCDAATAAPASKRARTSSLHDDAPSSS